VLRGRLRLCDRGRVVVWLMRREVDYITYWSDRSIGIAIANEGVTYTDSAFTPSGRSVVI